MPLSLSATKAGILLISGGCPARPKTKNRRATRIATRPASELKRQVPLFPADFKGLARFSAKALPRH
jgi:hypothetical protein